MAKNDKAPRDTTAPGDSSAPSDNGATKKIKAPKGTTASGLGGAAIGAAVGTAAGPVGTLVGAVTGAVIGAGGSTFASGATHKTEDNKKIVLGEGITRDINGNLPGENRDAPDTDTKR